MTKTCCTKCKVYKENTLFYKDKKKSNGLQSWCKSCIIQKVCNHQKTLEGKVTHAKALKNYKQTDKYRQTKRKCEANWKRTPTGQEYDRKKSLKRYWNDPEHGRLKETARRHGTPIGVLKAVQERDKICQLCKTDQDIQFDHIHPVSLGGLGTYENLQLLCGPCNNFKSNNLFLPDGGMMLIGKQHVINKLGKQDVINNYIFR